jgi:hypothetical protein
MSAPFSNQQERGRTESAAHKGNPEWGQEFKAKFDEDK